MKKAQKGQLTPPAPVVPYDQQTRQASALWGTLKFGGFLLYRKSVFWLLTSRSARAILSPTIPAKPLPFGACSNRRVTHFWRWR